MKPEKEEEKSTNVMGGTNDVLGGGNCTRKSRVSYYFDEDFAVFQVSDTHPIKPLRVKMTDTLIREYDMLSKMDQIDVDETFVNNVDLTNFHSDDYVDALKNITEDKQEIYQDLIREYFTTEYDCPVFDHMHEYCQRYTAGTLLGSAKLAANDSDIAINWAGGLHHAKKCEASGFCYVNDCVLGILELLKTYHRVLYIDIDCHHGDGVEEAFLTTDRVMTVSFHKYGNYFPGTGALEDIGLDAGKYYSVNYPMNDGMDDVTYELAFKPVMKSVMDNYKPEVIMICCGADSLCGDRLGTFNMSVRGHGECITYMKSFGVPMLLIGGGGYTLRNVARCWTYETSIALGHEIDNNIPPNDYSLYFHPANKIHVQVSNQENLNPRAEIEQTTKVILENLKKVKAVTTNYDYYING